MNNLVVIGAGRANLGICHSAKKLGVPLVIVTKKTGNFPCEPYADQIVLADILNPYDTERAIANIKITGIASACSDRPLHTQAYLISKLNLPGISPFTAQISQNKILLKNCLYTAGVNLAPYRLIENSISLFTAAKEIGFPLVVKPNVGQGSTNVNIISDMTQIECWATANQALDHNEWIVESYLAEPYEFGAQAFLSNGELLFLALHNDKLFSQTKPIPIQHSFPFELPKELQSQQNIIEDAKHQCRIAIEAIQIKNGAVNIDLIYHQGKVYVLEITNRVGANGLGEAISAHFGINYYDMIVYSALGFPVDELWENRYKQPKAAIAQMLYPPLNMEVAGYYFDDVSEIIVENQSFLSEPCYITEITSSADAIGQIVIVDSNIQSLSKQLSKVLNHLRYVSKGEMP